MKCRKPTKKSMYTNSFSNKVKERNSGIIRHTYLRPMSVHLFDPINLNYKILYNQDVFSPLCLSNEIIYSIYFGGSNHLKLLHVL